MSSALGPRMGRRQARGPVRARRTLLAALLSLAVLAALDQAVLHLALRDGLLAGRPIAPFDPPLLSPSQRTAFARMRRSLESGDPPEASFHLDPLLGWAPPKGGTVGADRYDWAGARFAGRETARDLPPGVRRVVAVGCSFTHGEEVSAEEAWPAVVDARREDLEVVNLGFGAYGLDQALLRWRRDGAPLAPDEVWLGFLPAAALRVTTVYRPALRHWANLCAFKPRFELEPDGGLRLVHPPAGDLRATVELLSDPERFLAACLPHDTWIARYPGAWAKSGSRAWHRSALARLAMTLLERRGRSVPAHLLDASDEATRLIEAIARALDAEARAAGVHARVLVLPGRGDLEDRRARGRGAWEPLTERLQAAGVEVVDLAPTLAAAGGASNDALWAPGGHYSPLANRLVAETLSRL